MGFDFSLAGQAGHLALSLAPEVRQNLRSVPGIRRSNSMGSAYLPRMSSTVSRVGPRSMSQRRVRRTRASAVLLRQDQVSSESLPTQT